jgi:hypothetical protein
MHDLRNQTPVRLLRSGVDRYGRQQPPGRNPAFTASSLVANLRVQFAQFAYLQEVRWNTRLLVLPEYAVSTA